MDQSGFYLLPAVVRSYAPVGQTPVLQEKLSRDHLSVISAISLEGKLYMMEQERSFKGEDVVRFLKHLLGQVWQVFRQVVGSLGRLADTSWRGGKGLPRQRGFQAAYA